MIFILVFTGAGGLRGQGTGVNRAYWKVLSLYVATPLANSLSLIRYENNRNLGLADFYIGGSDLGQTILDNVGIKSGNSLKKIL